MASNSNALPSEFSPTGGGRQGRPSSPTDSPNQNVSAPNNLVSYSARQGSVVIRATVEHIGLVGDTEMTVNVKWPASAFSAAPCTQSSVAQETSANKPHVPANGPEAHTLRTGLLYGMVDSDPGPLQSDTIKSRAATLDAQAESCESNNQQADYIQNQGEGEKKP